MNHSVQAEQTHQIRYRIDNMDCPTEEKLIRKRLDAMPSIDSLDFNLLDRELTVHHRLENTQSLADALVDIGMQPVLLEAGAPPPVLGPIISFKQKILMGISGLTALGAEVVAWSTGVEASIPVALLAIVSISAGGLPTLYKGWIALKNLTLNIHFLMSLAVIGALVIGQWPEAAMVVFLFAVAEAIESLSLERARSAIKSLTALAPDVAHVQTAGQWQETAVATVTTGTTIRVRAGERVPLDATVSTGQAALDQAPITGESLPVDKTIGDVLYAGSIVTDGVVEARVTACATDSTLARIATAIQQAQSQRAPTQRFVDQFARYYTPIVVAFAALIALLGPVFFAGSWTSWVYQALVLLVIACPCALVISTPVTVVSGLAAAAKQGILIKGGSYLEGGRLLKALALDKTGTLTYGKPKLTDTQLLAELTQEQSLHIAASLDDASTHPIARAIVSAWQAQQDGNTLAAVAQFSVLPGKGVAGSIENHRWHLGNARLLEEQGFATAATNASIAQFEAAGKTTVVLCNENKAVALFAVADTLREQSPEAISALKELGIVAVMLTGDNQPTADSIGRSLGISDIRGNLLPEEKQAAIADLKSTYGPTAMVGDGINDAPALARADIGFAMGAAGTATALETADVAIMDDDPKKLADFIRLSRRAGRVLKQNIALAIGIKVVFLTLALMGYATLWMAVFADMGGSLLVVFNGLRLLKSRTG